MAFPQPNNSSPPGDTTIARHVSAGKHAKMVPSPAQRDDTLIIFQRRSRGVLLGVRVSARYTRILIHQPRSGVFRSFHDFARANSALGRVRTSRVPYSGTAHDKRTVRLLTCSRQATFVFVNSAWKHRFDSPPPASNNKSRYPGQRRCCEDL